MLLKTTSLFLLLTASTVTSAQNSNLTLQPEKPKPGDAIQITYTANPTVFSNRDTLKCTAYVYGDYTTEEALSHGFLYKTKEVRLIKKGNTYQGELQVAKEAKALVFNFTAGNLKLKKVGEGNILQSGKFDSNNSLGYLVPIYDTQGNLLPKANYYIGYYLAYGAHSFAFSNPKLSRTYFVKELDRNDGSVDPLLVPFLKGTFSDDEIKDFKTLANDQINKILTKDSLTEDDYSVVAQFAYYTKQNGLSKYFANEQGRKFGEKSLMKPLENAVQEYSAEQDIDKKYALLGNHTTKFNDLPEKYKLQCAYSSFVPYIARINFLDYVLEKGTLEQYEAYTKKLNFEKKDILFLDFFIIQHFATLLEKLKNYPLAVSEGKDYLAYYDQQYEKIKTGKATSYGIWDDFMTREVELEEVQKGRILLNWNLAKAYSKSDDNAKAFGYISEAKKQLATLQESFYYTPQINELYVSLAEKQLPEQKLKSEVENLIAGGKWSQPMVDILKRIYVKEKGSETGFDVYLKSLKQSNLADIKKTVVAQQLNIPAPAFVLSDLDGKTVSLADLKGKTVILDFWATWCGPCKASFPGMKKLQATYRNNPDVVLLFVDTFERFKTSEENKTAVKDFITKNDYPFQVLFDSQSKVSADYGVSGIPSKIIVDKNGVIRYRMVGAELEEGKLIDEITVMIESVK